MPTTAANVAELARCLKVSRAAVRSWRQHPEWTCGGAPWSVERVRAWRSRNLDQPRGGAASAEERAARLGVLVERTALLQLQNHIRRGTLVKRDAVRRDWAAACLGCRDKLLSIPHTLARALHPDDDDERRRVEEGIDAAIRGVLTRLADG